MNIYIILASFILIGISMYFFGYRYEKRQWNNGKCSNCLNEWKYFDTDSQGGRGYKCSCPRYIWITYLID